MLVLVYLLLAPYSSLLAWWWPLVSPFVRAPPATSSVKPTSAAPNSARVPSITVVPRVILVLIFLLVFILVFLLVLNLRCVPGAYT